METRNTTPLSLCESCIYMNEYGAIEWEHDTIPAANLGGMLISLAAHDDAGNACEDLGGRYLCEGHFGGHCDGCDTQLGGERYCYIGVARS